MRGGSWGRKHDRRSWLGAIDPFSVSRAVSPSGGLPAIIVPLHGRERLRSAWEVGSGAAAVTNVRGSRQELPDGLPRDSPVWKRGRGKVESQGEILGSQSMSAAMPAY